MPVEITDPDRLERLFAADPIRNLELLDLLLRGGDETLTVVADDGDRPVNWVAVRWGAGPMGLSHVAEIRAGRLRGLEEVIEALPRARGTYELVCPFWVAPVLEQVFRVELQGPVSRYRLRKDLLGVHPAEQQTVPFGGEDLELVGLAFPRTVPEAPHRALILRDTLAAVAVTTAAAAGQARMGVHVMEEQRGHGFGSAVATALARDLLEADLVPTAEVRLADEPSVRLVERLGMVQVDTAMRVTAVGRHANP